MNNPSQSVRLIENAIDRLIAYGDRIHAVYRTQHPEEKSNQLEVAASQRSLPTTSRSQSSERRTSIYSTTTKVAEVQPVRPDDEVETVNNYLYTVSKGGRRCTIPGKMYSRRLPDSWVAIRFVLFDEDGGELLNLRTEIRGEQLRNTTVNGRNAELVP
ncbi:unnamed protein product [Cylicocyclus nassatus]|uniref:Uncharacterized protein n=1 Tax=Cylicocyclus nassatus TaxID=53992 RepID=A0AA36GK49_CYLNA|nr:unnamed protein product [Cylicocyclus nassatus]